MHTHTIKHSLAAVLTVATVACPATAQAFHREDSGSSAQVPVTGPQLHAPSLQSGGSSFEWGDAGIGAASVLALLGVGAGAVTLGRNRDVVRG
jgi:hypothetical protein